MASPSFILASRSPRRIELLRAAGFDFSIAPADIDESAVPPGLSPQATAEFLARGKALVVAQANPGAVVLGADTVVAVGDRLYGKAESPEEARAILTALGGTRQAVITGVALIIPEVPEPIVEAEVSIVEMRAMAPLELDAYLASNAWQGKAGAYGIQDQDPLNDPFVKISAGDYANVVGLPIERVIRLLAGAGIVPSPTNAKLPS